MRSTRLILTAVLSAGLFTAVAVPVQASPAPIPRASSGNGCIPEGQTGLYLSKSGDATVTFTQDWAGGLAAAGVSSIGTTPNQISDDGFTMTLPIGEDYDNIELPSAHVCYPGGMVYSNPDTGATYEIKDFWVVFNPAPFNVSQFYTYPIINGQKSAKKVVFANFSTPQGVADIRPKPNGVGPNDVKLYTNPDFVRDFNSIMGTSIRPGAKFGDLEINWRGVPTKPFTYTPATAGLKLIADAINPFLGS